MGAKKKKKSTKKGPRTFAVLIEKNDSEGETWKFYIPCEGNQVALDSLKATIRAIEDEDEPEFVLSDRTFTEEQVDVLVENNGRGGYMPSHNKLEGYLILPDPLPTDVMGLSDLLYKGAIESLMSSDAHAD